MPTPAKKNARADAYSKRSKTLGQRISPSIYTKGELKLMDKMNPKKKSDESSEKETGKAKKNKTVHL